MKALMTGVPFRCIDTTDTGAVTGTPFALPFPSKGLPTPTVLVVPIGAVSAFEYDVYASTDGGTTWVLIGDGITTQAEFTDLQGYLSFPLLRIDQISRTNGTSQALDVTLASY